MAMVVAKHTQALQSCEFPNRFERAAGRVGTKNPIAVVTLIMKKQAGQSARWAKLVRASGFVQAFCPRESVAGCVERLPTYCLELPDKPEGRRP